MSIFQVCVLEGCSADLIPRMADMFGIQTFDFVFFDHWKDRYLPDIRLLEVITSDLWSLNPLYALTSNLLTFNTNGPLLQDCCLLARGSVVLADNVVCPGAPDYLNYIRSNLNYSSRFYQAHLEYTRVLDGLERSQYLGHGRQGEIQTGRQVDR